MFLLLPVVRRGGIAPGTMLPILNGRVVVRLVTDSMAKAQP